MVRSLRLIEEVYTAESLLLKVTVVRTTGRAAEEVRNAPRHQPRWMVVRYTLDMVRSKQTL